MLKNNLTQSDKSICCLKQTYFNYHNICIVKEKNVKDYTMQTLMKKRAKMAILTYDKLIPEQKNYSEKREILHID